MSRLGKKPIEIPPGVDVELNSNRLTVKGPKGELEFTHHIDVTLNIAEKEITVLKKGKTNFANAIWGTTVRILENMIVGVTEGFQKQLELNGVGYRMSVQGKMVDFALGFSHPVKKEIPESLEVVIDNNQLTVSGIDKQKVGQFAAEIRKLRPVEPYKGKGFKYADEIVRRKEGKKAVASA